MNKMYRMFRVGAVALCVISATGVAQAQNVGSLQGEVTDPSGDRVPRASVKATDVGTGTVRTTQTEDNGGYSFSQLQPGVYQVQVSKQGFETSVREQVSVLVSTPTTLNVRLVIGAVSERVTITAEAAPAINTLDATVGNSFGEKEVKSLPFLARNAVNLLTLQPGVVFTGASDTDLLSMGTIKSLDLREGSVDGVRGNQTNVTVDGVDSNDWQNQSAFTSALPVTLDSVQEFRVTTTNANSTDGSVGGPQVALVTKSGSNDFHGNLRWYYRTSGTAANQFYNNQAGIPRSKLQRNIPGASLGGPIKKERAFFFVDSEFRREASSEPVVPRQVPSDTLRDGVLVYQCLTASQCPGGPVQGLTTLHIITPGNFGLTPAQFQSLDPTGQGVNQAMISLFNSYPSGNAPTFGSDGGLNFNALEFNSPIIRNTAVQTARLDYKLTRDGRHSIFWRGTLGDFHVDLRDAQFPGQPAGSRLFNNTKGFAVQYEGQLSSNLVNTARYGLTRLGVEETGAAGASFRLQGIDTLFPSTGGGNAQTAALRDASHHVPVHNINDDVTYTRGAHTFQMGGSVRFIRNQRTNLNNFPDYRIANAFCTGFCDNMVTAINNNPGLGFPAVLSDILFEGPMVDLTGLITQVTATFLSNPKTGAVLPSGSPERRDFAENTYEIYGQDSWRLRPNVTLTLGLRYEYETPPWEANGFQVTPTTDILQWFRQREINMNQGIPSSASPLLSWNVAGRANGKPSWYNSHYKNFAPRVALAYSPNFSSGIAHKLFGDSGQTSIRLGGGIFYDRIGQALTTLADLSGSPGTATAIRTPSGAFNLTNAPRFSGSCTTEGVCSGLPALSSLPGFGSIPTSLPLPFTPLSNFSGVGYVVPQSLTTPYSIHLTASVQRQFGKSLVVEAAYVGTLGRRLLGKFDYAQYLDIRDPKSKVDLWSAYRQIAALANITPTGSGPAIPVSQVGTIQSIPFFDNMLPNMPGFVAQFDAANPGLLVPANYAGMTPTQAFYAFTSQTAGPASWSCSLFFLDTSNGGPGGFSSPWNTTVDPQGTGFVLFQPQFQDLPGWTNFANSNYHSLQFSVRKSTGIATFGFNYVLSHSIDNGSGAENGDINPSGPGNDGSLIENPFDLRAGRASSDFDLRHNFNANWVLDLPFGQGRRFGAHAGRVVDALIGGWQVSGLARWRSGFPLSPVAAFSFPTDFFLATPTTLAQPIGTSVVRNGQNGLPNLFKNAAAALASLNFTGPGLSGSRNIWRGPAYADFDAGVAKNFRIPFSEKHRIQLRVTAFNVFNNVNFSDSNLSLDPTIPNTFGQFTQTSGPRGGAREIEFSARYEF